MSIVVYFQFLVFLWFQVVKIHIKVILIYLSRDPSMHLRFVINPHSLRQPCQLTSLLDLFTELVSSSQWPTQTFNFRDLIVSILFYQQVHGAEGEHSHCR